MRTWQDYLSQQTLLKITSDTQPLYQLGDANLYTVGHEVNERATFIVGQIVYGEAVVVQV